MNSSLPGTSRWIYEPKFQGQLQHIQPDESVIDTIDGFIEIFDGSGLKPKYDLAIVLTNKRLIGFRGSGILGSKAPFTVDLAQVEKVGVTRQFNVNVEFKGDYGQPGWWKLHVGEDEPTADRWMQAIHGATLRIHGMDPNPAPRPGGPSPEWHEMRAHLQDFCNELAPFASSHMVGQPFGEGLGLEQVMQLVYKHFSSVEQVREAGSTVAVDLLTAQDVGPADLDHVMGVSSLRSGSITPEQAQAADGLAGAAKVFLGQLDEDGANMWELWKRRTDVAGEFLCWHTIARLRLATIGKLGPI